MERTLLMRGRGKGIRALAVVLFLCSWCGVPGPAAYCVPDPSAGDRPILTPADHEDMICGSTAALECVRAMMMMQPCLGSGLDCRGCWQVFRELCHLAESCPPPYQCTRYSAVEGVFPIPLDPGLEALFTD